MTVLGREGPRYFAKGALVHGGRVGDRVSAACLEAEGEDAVVAPPDVVVGAVGEAMTGAGRGAGAGCC